MNDKKKIVFVILHYLVMQDTIECIESIHNHIDTEQYHIIVVDNASSNNSGKELFDMYDGDDKVTVILNEENLGFARGNNVGYRYAVKHYDLDYIALINNDTLLIQDGMCAKLDSEYKKSKFAALGPLIFTADGRCDSNPASESEMTREYIVNRLHEERFRWKFVKRGLPNPVTFVKKITYCIKGRMPQPARKRYLCRQENIRLHGCFMIFSQKYIENFPNGLDESTFLYHEEDILQVHLMKNSLKTVYLPLIKVYHKEDAATNAMKIKSNELKKFVYKKSLDSCEALLRIYDSYN